jgi:hypothetical protein
MSESKAVLSKSHDWISRRRIGHSCGDRSNFPVFKYRSDCGYVAQPLAGYEGPDEPGPLALLTLGHPDERPQRSADCGPRRWLVQHGPEHSEIPNGFEKLVEADRLDDICIHAEHVAL